MARDENRGTIFHFFVAHEILTMDACHVAAAFTTVLDAIRTFYNGIKSAKPILINIFICYRFVGRKLQQKNSKKNLLLYQFFFLNNIPLNEN